MRKKLTLLLTITFLLNLFWEVSHSLLYNWDKAPLVNNVYLYISRILLASLSDLIIISSILLIISLKYNSLKWIGKPSNKDYIILIMFSLLASIFIEIRALSENRWSYNENMPLIFGLGFSPIIQLFSTALLALWFVRDN